MLPRTISGWWPGECDGSDSKTPFVVLAASSTVGITDWSLAAGFLLTELLIPLVMDAIGESARVRMALWEEQRRSELLPGRPTIG